MLHFQWNNGVSDKSCIFHTKLDAGRGRGAGGVLKHHLWYKFGKPQRWKWQITSHFAWFLKRFHSAFDLVKSPWNSYLMGCNSYFPRVLYLSILIYFTDSCDILQHLALSWLSHKVTSGKCQFALMASLKHSLYHICYLLLTFSQCA